MTTDPRSPTIRPTENRFQLFSAESLSRVEMILYAALGLILSLAALFALFTACQALWKGLSAEASASTVVEVIDRLLVVFMLVEILHTVRISIRSHILVTEPFLIVGLIATIRRILVITLNAANLTNGANWANDGQAKLRASMLELALLGGTVIVLVVSIHILRKSKSPEEEQETKRAENRGSEMPG
jgi:phosphate starvation-inducible membrane PsiE